MSEIKLNKTQTQLVKTWENELLGVQQAVGKVVNELILSRIEKIAVELGIDVENEKWTYNFQAGSFTKVDEKPEPKMEIPGRKRGRPKKEEPVEDFDEEDEEPIPDDEDEK